MIRYLKTSKPVEAQAEIASQVRDTVANVGSKKSHCIAVVFSHGRHNSSLT